MTEEKKYLTEEEEMRIINAIVKKYGEIYIQTREAISLTASLTEKIVYEIGFKAGQEAERGRIADIIHKGTLTCGHCTGLVKKLRGEKRD